MEHQRKGQSLLSKLFSGSGWAIFTMFVWELVEEALENLIAYALSSAVALFVTKALSTLAIITATQGIKVFIKRFTLPFFRELTYKEGNDKVEILKKYWTKVWGNKFTGTGVGLGFAGLMYFQTIIPFATHSWWIALITFVVFYNLGVFLGGETLNQIQERLAQVALKKEQQAIIKDAKNRLAELEKKATQTQEEQEKAKAKELANREYEAKVQKAMADLKKIAEEKAKAKAEAQKAKS